MPGEILSLAYLQHRAAALDDRPSPRPRAARQRQRAVSRARPCTVDRAGAVIGSGAEKNNRAVGPQLEPVAAARERERKTLRPVDRQAIAVFFPGMAPGFEQAVEQLSVQRSMCPAERDGPVAMTWSSRSALCEFTCRRARRLPSRQPRACRWWSAGRRAWRARAGPGPE